MNLTDNNDPAAAATVPAEPMDIDAAMARLILLRKFHELPRPVKYEISTGEFGTFHGIYVYVATGQDVTAWANALGIAEHGCGSFLGHDGSLYYDASVDGWHGWYVRVVSEAPAGSAAPSELDADTVASLEEVAAKQEIAVSDDEHEPTFVRCESTDESNCCRCRLPADHRPGCRFVRLDRDEVSA